jgi:hypothetical protein
VRGRDHARRAEAALQRVMLAKGLLQRREVMVVGESFDRHDLAALGLHREHQTRAHRCVIDNDGAGAAHTMLATNMGSGEAEHMTQAIRQRHPRLDFDLDFFAVDFKSDWHARPWMRLITSCERPLARARPWFQ